MTDAVTAAVAVEPTIPTFDLTGDLPTGTVVLEASAGTGKTFTIAGLVTRWVAETGLPLPRILVVTFTRSATAELRDRVRDLLRDGHDHLTAMLHGTAPTTGHPVLTTLADTDDDAELRLRRDRLAAALADIDAATISTIHGFCADVLDGLGLATRLDRDAVLVEDHAELRAEVVDDLLVRARHERPGGAPVSRRALLELADKVVGNRVAPIEPATTDDPTAAWRVAAAAEIRSDVEERAKRRGWLSYDDLLVDLDRALADPESGAAARAAVRDRYRVVLVDEFQDTDPVQWRIFRTCFVDGEPEPAFSSPTRELNAGGDATPAFSSTRRELNAGGGGLPARACVLIGDPKQAIYAFRGADVHAYLDAVAAAADRRTLATSWRSDARLLHGLQVLLGGATFGDPDIAFQPVAAAPGRDQPGAKDTAGPDAPIRIRRVTHELGLPTGRGHLPLVDHVRPLIADDVATEVVAMLAAEPELRDARDGAWRPLQPHDVAVLVRSNAEASLVHDALRRADVPAVVGGGTSVFVTGAATDWQRLLDALERPSSAARVRALAVSAWIGWSGDQVVAASETVWDQLHEDVRRWAMLLTSGGVAAVQRAVLDERDVRARLVGRAGGERHLTDLAHVGEVLHVVGRGELLPAVALAARLRDLTREAKGQNDEHQLRRLETDDEAVQVLTIHRSKGLEFGVVLAPYLWSGFVDDEPEIAVFHDDARERRLDVGGIQHPEYAANTARALTEDRGEHLRLLYVALTRARHELVVWYAPSGGYEWSPLGRLLLCRDTDGRPRLDDEVPDLDDEDVAARIDRLVHASSGTIVDEIVPLEPLPGVWRPTPPEPPRLRVASFDRELDTIWRRTSYSALAHTDDVGASSPGVAEPEDQLTDDETLADDPLRELPGSAPDVPAIPAPLVDLPGGAEVGTMVHAVIEHTDFTAPDLAGELHRAAREQQRRFGSRLDLDLLAVGLEAALLTPLGPAAGDLRLRDVVRGMRRDEVDYELPLDGDRHAPVVVGDVIDLLAAHLPPGDLLAAYPERVPEEILRRPLRGYLGGSIDLLLRRETPDGDRFHVMDHKTNWLGPARGRAGGDELTTAHYAPAAMADAMMRGHYPLQALLYAVATHRLLRWRVPDYTPATKLGPVLYTFVRGMVGPATPLVDGMRCGVFAWDLPPTLVEATSNLLSGEKGARG